MNDFPSRHDSFASATSDTESEEALANQGSEKMPASVRIAVVCWLILIAWLLLAIGRSIVFEGVRGFLLGLLIAGGIAGAHLVGLLRRSRAGWLWNRNTTRTLGTWALLPLLFGLACMVFALTGGNVPVGMRMPAAILFYAGLLSLIPAILLWAIYVSLNRPTAKRYYRVCPDCAKRIKGPIYFLFRKTECDRCRDKVRVGSERH